MLDLMRLNLAPSKFLSGVICCLGLLAAAQSSAEDAVTLSPAVVVAGSPELIRVDAPGSAKISGEWLNQKLEFFHAEGGRGWVALAGVDVEAPAGESKLTITEKLSDGSVRNLSQTVEIHVGPYRTGKLTVAPKFVEPSPEALAQTKAEVELKKRVFSSSAPEPLWTGSFRKPVTAPPTDSFGTRRTFNGELASVHKGMDFRAKTGTPVHAANAGVVVLARKLYYEGNCVVVDHGLGVFTISMHLSRIDVHEGEHVTRGQLLGLSGATGRVTGPHLHWAVRWQQAYLDPAKLFRLDLTGVH